MASLDRAHGARGALIAIGMACVAGGVHGVFAHSFDFLAVKIVIGLAGSVVLLMAGTISARQRVISAVLIGSAMGFCFFVTRWSGWSLMEGGLAQAAEFLTTLPNAWPAYLKAHAISAFWIFEAVSMAAVALFGCLVGQERAG